MMGQWSKPSHQTQMDEATMARQLWCSRLPPLPQQVWTFVFGLPPHIFKEPKWRLIYQLLKDFFCLFDWCDVKFYDFLLSVFEGWGLVKNNLQKKSFTCVFMDNIAFTVNMWEIYMANILKIVHIKKSTNSLTLTVLLFYETIQELRILDPPTLAQVSYL